MIYDIACLANEKNKHIDIYDLLPLPTDPTPEERKKMEEKKKQDLRNMAKQIFDYYKSEGYLN